MIKDILKTSLLFVLAFGLYHCTKKEDQKAAGTSNQHNLTMEQAQFRAKHVSDVHYDLEFKIGKGKSFSGKVKAEFYLKNPVDKLFLDFYKGNISSIQVNGKRSTAKYDGRFVELSKSTLVKGKNRVQIEFTHDYSNDGRGLFSFTDPEDQRTYLYSNLEPYELNNIFPNFDQPDLKATYSAVVNAPAHWEVITSVRETNIVTENNKTKTWIFPKSAKYSTYIFPLHAGPYHKWEDNSGKIPLRLFARKSLAKYVKVKDWFKPTHQGFKYFQKYFDYPYPYKKYDQIIVPEFNSGAMENVGAVTFSERYVSRGVKPRKLKRGLASVILHEMAHMWFGNLVTMKWWNDLWLNESFATYMAAKALYASTEYKEAWQSFHGTKEWAYWEDQLITTHPIEAVVPDTKQAFANFDGITYGKGASTLQQIDFFLGHETFKKGVQNYFKKYAESNTELKDFMGALAGAAKKDLGPWQKLWLQTSGLNTVTADYTCESGKIKTFNLKQGYSDDKYPHIRHHRLKVAFFSKSGSSLKLKSSLTTTIKAANNPVKEAIGKACPDFIYPNYQDNAYIKVQLDKRSLETLGSSRTGLNNIKDNFVRQLTWASVWGMVIDGQLPVATYANWVKNNIFKENNLEILNSVLRSVYGSRRHGWRPKSASIMNYYPKETEEERKAYNHFMTVMDTKNWVTLKNSKPGSEQQKVFLESYMNLASTATGLKNLKALLDGREKLRGVTIDQDRRWQIILQLAEYRFADIAEVLTKEAKKDNSSAGKLFSLASQASLSSWEGKQKFIKEALSTSTEYSYQQLRYSLNNLFPRHQTEDRSKYTEVFFKDLLTVHGKKSSLQARVFTSLSPTGCSSEDESKITSFLKKHKDLHPAVAKDLKITRQEGQRCQRAKALAKKRTL